MPPYELESDDFTEQVPQVLYNRKDSQSLGLVSFVVAMFVPFATIFVTTHFTSSLADLLKIIAIAVIIEAIAVITLICVINAWWRKYRADRPRR